MAAKCRKSTFLTIDSLESSSPLPHNGATNEYSKTILITPTTKLSISPQNAPCNKITLYNYSDCDNYTYM